MKIAPCITLAFLLISPAVHLSAQDGNSIPSQAPETSAANTSAKSTNGKEASDNLRSSDSAEAAQKSYDSGLALYDSGKLDEAIVALKASTKLRPDDSQSQFLLGMAYSQAKSYKDAAESFKRAARYRPDWPEAHFRLGVMSYVLGRRGTAIEAYRRLLELNSPLANTLYRIVRDSGSAVENAEKMKVASDFVSTKVDEPLPVPPPIAVTSTSAAAAEPATANPAKAEAEKVSASVTTGTQPQPARTTNATAVDEATLTGIYRVGVGDILDIRFLNTTVNRSSLYSVIDGGIIDIPVAGGAMSVAGLTTEEVQARIAAELKRRAVEQNAQISVGVRHYGSHTIIITGLVSSSGTKILRREAVPLYVILAEAQPRLDAARASIMRANAPSQVIELNDSGSLGYLVRPGDVINITSRPQEFYYIAGRVNYPGQKTFQPGITLLQAILAAGGTARPNDNNIELSREGENGLLDTAKISLKDIKSGKVQDPRLKPGDRIEVVN